MDSFEPILMADMHLAWRNILVVLKPCDTVRAMTAKECSMRHALILNYACCTLSPTKGLEDIETATRILGINCA